MTVLCPVSVKNCGKWEVDLKNRCRGGEIGGRGILKFGRRWEVKMVPNTGGRWEVEILPQYPHFSAVVEIEGGGRISRYARM